MIRNTKREIFGAKNSYTDVQILTRGYAKINDLLEQTLSRLNETNRNLYFDNAPLKRGIRAISASVAALLRKAGRGETLETSLDIGTLYKLSMIVLVPGKDQYFGDTKEGRSLFLEYAIGNTDGIPAHLKGIAPLDIEAMPTEQLIELKTKADRLLADRTIDLEAVPIVDTLIASLLDHQCLSEGISRVALAETTIGRSAMADLMSTDRTFSEAEIRPLALRLGIPPVDLLEIRRISNSRSAVKADRNITAKSNIK